MDKYISVDGESARDLDDGYSIKEVESGWELSIYIACPALVLKIDDPLVLIAEKKGASIYSAAKVISPMFPVELSESALSLLPNKSMDVFCARFSVNSEGHSKLLGIDVRQAENIGKLSYSDVSDSPEQTPQINKLLRVGLSCARSLFYGRLSSLNSLAFLDAKTGTYTDEDGNPQVFSVRDIHGHILIQEFMILTNSMLAQYALDKGLPVIFRNHKSLSLDKFRESEPQLYNFYYNNPSKIIREKLGLLVGKAEYAMVNAGHVGLGLKSYATFSSPLRRFVCLQNQYVLLAHLNNQKHPEFSQDRCDGINSTLLNSQNNTDESCRAIMIRRTLKAIKTDGDVTTNQLSQVLKHSTHLKDRGAAAKYLLKTKSHQASARPWCEIICNAQEFTKDISIKLRKVFESSVGLNDQVYSSLVSRRFLKDKKLSAYDKRVLVLTLLSDSLGIDVPVSVVSNKEENKMGVIMSSEKNYKSKLSEICQKQIWSLPEFSSVNKGSSHLPLWECEGVITIGDKSFGATGQSDNKKSAEQMICKQLLEFVKPLIEEVVSTKSVVNVTTLVVGGNSKAALNELSQKLKFQPPKYETVGDGKSPQAFISTCRVFVKNKEFTKQSGACISKKTAEQSAAGLVLKLVS